MQICFGELHCFHFWIADHLNDWQRPYGRIVGQGPLFLGSWFASYFTSFTHICTVFYELYANLHRILRALRKFAQICRYLRAFPSLGSDSQLQIWAPAHPPLQPFPKSTILASFHDAPGSPSKTDFLGSSQYRLWGHMLVVIYTFFHFQCQFALNS